MGRKPKINKEESAESWCFKCKDGGETRICDFKNCLKVYHPQCVEKKKDFLTSDDIWNCGWHFCFLCQNTSKFRCFSCPKAVCKRCLCDAQFYLITETNGFCINCATLAALIEGVKKPDPDEEIVDFNDENTLEGLFKSYWEIMKKEQNLNVQHVRKAMKLFSKDINYSKDFYCNGIDEVTNSLNNSDDDDGDSYGPDSDPDVFQRKKRKRYTQRNIKPRKKDFVGWGSQSLMDFLAAIGEDTSREYSQLDVDNIISRYCSERSLFHPGKPKKVICDSRLQDLLGKKSVNKHCIYELLSAHFANIGQEEDSGDDEYNTGLWRGDVHDMDEYNNGCNSMARTKTTSAACKRKAQDVPERNHEPPPNEAVPKKAQSCFALIISQNIKLVYLKKSLVEQLLTKPETSDEKIIGSFVRVKSDPNDYMQRASHQLQLVTDVKRSQVNGCTSTGILLRVSNRHQDIAISQLSDDYFSDEECEDLGKRMKDGLLRRLTVVELREKAKALHEDITEHRISKELAQLTILIDQANVKGWRKELSEYLDRRILLQTPAEQSRLLQKVPEIITDHAGELVHADESTMAQTEHAVKPAPTPTRQKHCALGVKTSGSLQCMNSEEDFQGHKSSFRIRPKSGLARFDPNCNRGDSSTRDDVEIAKGKMQQSERSTSYDPRQISAKVHESRDDTAIQRESEEPNQEKSKSFCRTSYEGTSASGGSRSPYLHEQSVTAHKSRNDIATRAQNQDCNQQEVRSFCKRSTGGELLSGEERKEQSTGQPLEQPATAVGLGDANNGAADYESNHEPVRSHPKTSCSEFPSEQPTVLPGQVNNLQAQNKAIDVEPNKVVKQSAIPDLLILSDDEDSDASSGRSRKNLENMDSSKWYINHPEVGVRGPYSILVLKDWFDTRTSDVEFKVWRVNQSQEEAVNISDVVRQYYGGYKSSFRIRPKSGLARSDPNCNGRNRGDSSTRDDGEIAKGKMQQSERSTSHDPHQLSVKVHETAIRRESEVPNQEKSKSFCKSSHEGTPASGGSSSPYLHEQSVTAHKSRNDIATRAQNQDCNHQAIRSSPKRSTGERKEQSTRQPLEIPELIILGDDEDSDASIGRSRKKLEKMDSSQWYISRPEVGVRGPYSISVLKDWLDTRTSDVEFKVWRVIQSQEEAVNLSDAIRQYYGG